MALPPEFKFDCCNNQLNYPMVYSILPCYKCDGFAINA